MVQDCDASMPSQQGGSAVADALFVNQWGACRIGRPEFKRMRIADAHGSWLKSRLEPQRDGRAQTLIMSRAQRVSEVTELVGAQVVGAQVVGRDAMSQFGARVAESQASVEFVGDLVEIHVDPQ